MIHPCLLRIQVNIGKPKVSFCLVRKGLRWNSCVLGLLRPDIPSNEQEKKALKTRC